LAAATGEVWALSAFLAAARLQVATVLLLPLSLPLPALAARGWRYAVAAGLALALHFVSWIASLALTSIAASTALVTTHPMWVALAARLVWGQRLGRARAAGTLLATAGCGLIAWGDAAYGGATRHSLLGDGLALVGAMAAGTYFALGRAARGAGLGTRSYATVAYATAAIVLAPLPPVLGMGYWPHPPVVYGCILLLGALLLGEIPTGWVLGGCALLLVGLVIALGQAPRPAPPELARKGR